MNRFISQQVNKKNLKKYLSEVMIGDNNVLPSTQYIFDALKEVGEGVTLSKQAIRRHLKKKGFIFIGISTWTKIDNDKKRYVARMKAIKRGKMVKTLFQVHTGVWIKRKYKHIAEKIIKKRDKNGNVLIHFYGGEHDRCLDPRSKDFGFNKLHSYQMRTIRIIESEIRREKRKICQMEQITSFLSKRITDVNKISIDLSTDFMGFSQYIHKKVNSYIIKYRKNNKKNQKWSKYINYINEVFDDIISNVLKKE
jgi:hypothetical protein